MNKTPNRNQSHARRGTAATPPLRLVGLRLVVLFLFGLGVGAGRAGEAPKLNVLLIISDDLRAELGCYGSSIARTPNLDALAQSGVRFDRAYCQFPLCNPSRVSMLTGRHPTRTGVLGNRTDFRAVHPDWVSLPQLFKENGYASLRVGKIFHGGIDDPKAWTEVGGERDGGDSAAPHTGAPTQPAASGGTSRVVPNWPAPDEANLTQAQRSDRWLVLDGNGEGHPENGVADRTIQFLRAHKEEPFFIGCGFSKPHSPPTAPARFYEIYDPERIPLPPDYAPRPTVWEGFPRLSIRPRNADLFIGRDSTPQAAREMIRAYVASVSWMDWNVGRVIAELDRLGLRRKTVIVFWGDNGYQLGEKGKWSKAGSVWENGARIPLIVAAPGAKGSGKTSLRVVQSVDIYPTLVELCGLSRPEGLEGRSLVPLLNDPQAEWNHPAYTVWSEDGRNLTAVAVRTERWRYAEFDGGSGGAMLLDEASDPREMKNLADDPKLATVRSELSALVKQYAAAYVAR